MITALDEAYARLGMLEFALEVTMANLLSASSLGVSDKFKEDLVIRMRAAFFSDVLSSTGQEQKEAEIRDRAVQMMENFVRKVSERETEVRAQRPPPGASPP